MDPTFQFLLLKQEDRSLEDYTRDFLDLAHLTHYLDSCLCVFYYVGLNTTTKAKLSRCGPRGELRQLSWSSDWRKMNCISPSAPLRKTSPATLPNQRPASLHPAAHARAHRRLRAEPWRAPYASIPSCYSHPCCLIGQLPQ